MCVCVFYTCSVIIVSSTFFLIFLFIQNFFGFEFVHVCMKLLYCWFEFRFSSGCLTKAREPNLVYYLLTNLHAC